MTDEPLAQSIKRAEAYIALHPEARQAIAPLLNWLRIFLKMTTELSEARGFPR